MTARHPTLPTPAHGTSDPTGAPRASERDPVRELAVIVRRSVIDCGDVRLQHEVTTALSALARRADLLAERVRNTP